MMDMLNKLKFAGLAGCAVSMIAISPAAAASRCGGSLAIDAPTTLAKVARSCNVSLTALYEANPGVDPRNVRPGAHLAMPDEIDPYLPNPEQNSRDIVASKDIDDDYYSPVTDDHGLRGQYPDEAIRDYDARVSTRVRIREAQLASSDPVWLREATGGGARSYAADRRSYQQRSAARIHSAGVPSLNAPRNIVRTSAPENGAGTELISCAVLHNDQQGVRRKVRKIISTPTNTFVEVEPIAGGGFDCTLVSAAPDPNAVPLTPGVPAAHYSHPPKTIKLNSRTESRYRLPDFNAINPKADRGAKKIALSGDVIGEENGCLMLEADEGGLWALAAAPGAQSLVGKHVTAWGVSSISGACGASPTLVVSHAVYAEPWK